MGRFFKVKCLVIITVAVFLAITFSHMVLVTTDHRNTSPVQQWNVLGNEDTLCPEIKVPKPGILGNISKPYYHEVKHEGFKIDRTYFKLRDEQVSYVPDTYTILGDEVCRQSSHDVKPQTVFIVPSVATQQAARERLEIRQTWASSFYDASWGQQCSPSRIAFFFGSKGLRPDQLEALRAESATYKDIVVADIHDTYKNLSLKMAVCIDWVANNCPSTPNVVKVDMDTYINVDLMLSLVSQIPTNTHPEFIFGYQHAYLHPLVVRSGQWEVKKETYPFQHFPRYIYGHSYVVSGPAVRKMAKSFRYFPIVPNEDAFLTGILPVALNITQLYHNAFAFSLEKRTYCKMIHNFYASAIINRKNRIKLSYLFKDGYCSNDEL